MSAGIAAPRAVEQTKASVFVFAATTFVALGMTLLFLGMRAVMDIGGACATGGPYVSAATCPEGVPGLMLGGLWGGLAATGLYVWQVSKYSLPSFAGLLWPALFLSLGWNFLEYGIAPPVGDGPVWGWLVCGVIFVLMGGIPLLWVLPAIRQGLTRSAATARPAAARTVEADAAAGHGATATRGAASSTRRADVVSELERLAELRRSGAIDPDEYDLAKQRVLGADER